jgi:hypothetical protein
MKKLLFILFISVAGCDKPTDPYEVYFNEKFHQKFLGISASFGNHYPDFIPFCFDSNSFFDVKTNETFTLKIYGYTQQEDSIYITYQTSGTIELLYKNYVPSDILRSGYWEGEIKMKIGNDQPEKISFKLADNPPHFTFWFRSSIRVDFDDGSYFIIHSFQKEYIEC